MAAQNFLNKNTAYISGIAQQLLEGNIREIVGQMKLEQMVSDRQTFAEKVKENAEPDLKAMGLTLVSFNVQNFVDENGVIENLGVDNIVRIQKSAAISRAESEKEIAVAQANATKESNDAQIKAQLEIENAKAEATKQKAIIQANASKDTAINQIKSEVKAKVALTYKDEYELKDEIKKEIKEKVFESLIKEVNGKYLNQFDSYIEAQLTKNPDRLKHLNKEIKDELSERLYDDLYNSIRNEVIVQVRDTTVQLCNLIGGNSVKVKGSNKTISKKEYEDLLDRDRKLSALEAGGVDNWEWYGDSLAQYYGEDE